MTFFTKLGETISATGKDVSQKAKDLTELARLNLDIKAKEDFIEKQYVEIGKQYFALHKEDQEPPFEEINLISETLKEIERLKSEIADLKGKKKCPACGAVVEQDAVFCNQCGTKCESIFEEGAAAPVNDEADEEIEEDAVKEETIDFSGMENKKEEE
ncbi:MAG: zinc ribbon domain-containing protein [Lachnospiraceae bacterium]|nr:zinc ribbon domain-containing protein [Lachnospiraceae bacterium]